MSTRKGAAKKAAAPKAITRSAAITLLKDERSKAAKSRSGKGQIFSARWVAVGDEKSGPRVMHKALRFQVRKHLKGGVMAYNPEDHGYLGVYEMCNRTRAIKLYQEAAGHRLAELRPELETARAAAEVTAGPLAGLAEAAHQATLALGSAEALSYATKKAKTDAERPLKATKKTADRDLKNATEASERATRKHEKLAGKVAAEELKISDHAAALTAEITARIERLTEKHGSATEDGERADLAAKIEAEREMLADPVKSLMARYRLLNLNGLIALRIRGKDYTITTPPVPAIPENPADIEEADEDVKSDGKLIEA